MCALESKFGELLELDLEDPVNYSSQRYMDRNMARMNYQKAYREAARIRRLQQRAEANAVRAAKQAQRASKIADRALRDLSKYERYAQQAQRALKRYERALSVAKKHGVKLAPSAYTPPEEESLLRGLPEDVAGPIVDEAVHRVRGEIVEEQSNVAKLPPPSAEEIAEWEKRREERRRREAS